MQTNGNELVRLENISKTFPGVKALSNVHMTVRAGEVHGLVGENGAGKSTLIKVLTGAHQADPGGVIYINGEKCEIANPAQAKARGIGAVYQDVMMAPHLSVGENFFLGKLPRRGAFVDWARVKRETKESLHQIGVDIDPAKQLSKLTVGMQEMVAIGKILREKARVIIFDEPTALLTNEEVEELFRLIKRLREDGCGIIYISHRMEEIFRICDTVTVLKDGQYIDTVEVGAVDENQLISMMVGRKLEDMYSIGHPLPGEPALEVKGLSRHGAFEDVSFHVRKGEILGFYGLMGAGRTEVMRCVTGADRFDEGEIWIDGKPVRLASPKSSIQHGIAFLTEDRKRQGLCMNQHVSFNINIASYPAISRRGFINLRKERSRAHRYVEDIRIKTPSIYQRVKNLSGGNQQKVIVGRWLACESKVFLFDEPTVGVDVGAKVEIYRLFEHLLEQGAAIVVISSYLPEVMGLSDRVMVMSEGRIMADVPLAEFSRDGRMDEEKLVRLASGLKDDGYESRRSEGL
jgi:ribose transport system ATP-binding protein